jgi:hypothetical protein
MENYNNPKIKDSTAVFFCFMELHFIAQIFRERRWRIYSGELVGRPGHLDLRILIR